MFLDIDIKGVTCDYRKVKPGYAFVAIKEKGLNDSRHIEYALERGAAVIYTGEELEFLPENVPVIKVQNPDKTLAKLLARFYGYPSEKLNVIGVTGTNGKTITSHMIEAIFKTAGLNTGLVGSVSVRIGHENYPDWLNAYDSEMVQRFFDEMIRCEVYAAVLEVPYRALKCYSVECVDFNVAVHTNISSEHIRTHTGLEDYINTKRQLFNMLPSGGVAVINTDDPYGLELVRQNPRPLILTYGLGSKATITASSLDVNTSGISYTCCLQRSFTNMLGNDVEPQEIPLKLRIPGRYNVYNSLAAVAVALLYGIEIEIIQKALEDFRGVWRRMQVIDDYEFTVVDSYSHNPASYEAVFETIQSMDYDNIYIVNAIKGSSGTEINKKNGAVILYWASLLGVKEIIATSSHDVVGKAHSVTAKEKEAFLGEVEKGGVDIKYYDTLNEALDRALAKVRKGDMVLLMGAEGMDKGQELILEKINPQSEIKVRDRKPS